MCRVQLDRWQVWHGGCWLLHFRLHMGLSWSRILQIYHTIRRRLRHFDWWHALYCTLWLQHEKTQTGYHFVCCQCWQCCQQGLGSARGRILTWCYSWIKITAAQFVIFIVLFEYWIEIQSCDRLSMRLRRQGEGMCRFSRPWTRRSVAALFIMMFILRNRPARKAESYYTFSIFAHSGD